MDDTDTYEFVGDDGESDPHETEVFNEFISKMESWSRPFGLYLREAQGRRQPLEKYVLVGTDPVKRPFVWAVFTLGDEAFTDRVQHPELYSDEAVLAQIEHATLQSDAERIMAKFLETGEVFDADSD